MLIWHENIQLLERSVVHISGRHQQALNNVVTTLLEIAHIQDDILERLRADDRIPADRKGDCEAGSGWPYTFHPGHRSL
ncbi:hypothetical protein diail_11920 [Diaporthe ilicicola]|nr:hypothetical protein diail_11920 [Diaporthe ilicicola]